MLRILNDKSLNVFWKYDGKFFSFSTSFLENFRPLFSHFWFILCLRIRVSYNLDDGKSIEFSLCDLRLVTCLRLILPPQSMRGRLFSKIIISSNLTAILLRRSC